MRLYGIQKRVDGSEWRWDTSAASWQAFEDLLERAKRAQVLGSVEQLFMTGTTYLRMDRSGHLEEYRLWEDDPATSTTPLVCERCKLEIAPGDAVVVVGPEFDEDARVVTSDEALVVHETCPEPAP